jgi:carbamoyltransferase
MLYVVPVKKEKRSNLGAITHVDGTARPQFVDKTINPLYHKLITSFGKKTKIPVVLNTSFNLKGEPIVNTTREALSTFKRSGLDILVVNNCVIEKK